MGCDSPLQLYCLLDLSTLHKQRWDLNKDGHLSHLYSKGGRNRVVLIENLITRVIMISAIKKGDKMEQKTRG